MATDHSRTAARFMISPSVLLLLGWMIVPLSMTIWFSFQSYNLLSPGTERFIGFPGTCEKTVCERSVRHDAHAVRLNERHNVCFGSAIKDVVADLVRDDR